MARTTAPPRWANSIVRYGEEAPDQLLANPRNWRVHPQRQKEALVGSLNDLGWIAPVIVNETTGHVVDGHARIGEAIARDEPFVPVAYVQLTPEQEAEALAIFDPIAALAGADKAQLDTLLREIDTGEAGLQALLADVAKDAGLSYGADVPEAPEAQLDRAEELRQQWGVERGQLWEIPSVTVPGQAHRLLCGDSTDGADVARLMDGQRVVLMTTDPPYGVDFEGAKYNPRAKAWEGIKGDQRQGADLREWFRECLAVWLEHMTSDAAFYFWTSAMEEGAAAAAIRAAGLHIQSQIIWRKNVLVLGQADYQWRHENCWYAFWKGKQHRWFGGRDQTTVWEVSKVANSAYEHPMQKPTELFAIPMRNHTQHGEVVAEPFSGSGSQFVAGEQCGRLVYGCELEAKSTAVILDRLQRMGLTPRQGA